MKLSMLGNLCASLDLKREEKSDQPEGQVSRSTEGQRSEEPQPVFLILQQILPIIQKLLNVWISDTTVVEVRKVKVEVKVISCCVYSLLTRNPCVCLVVSCFCFSLKRKKMSFIHPIQILPN